MEELHGILEGAGGEKASWIKVNRERGTCCEKRYHSLKPDHYLKEDVCMKMRTPGPCQRL